MIYDIDIYETEDGILPFHEWLMKAIDSEIRQKIRVRLERVRLGNLGNCETVGRGIHELKCDFGPGYRIYFANINAKKIIILCAGTKRTQNKDIEKATRYFEDYKIRGKRDGKK